MWLLEHNVPPWGNSDSFVSPYVGHGLKAASGASVSGWGRGHQQPAAGEKVHRPGEGVKEGHQQHWWQAGTVLLPFTGPRLQGARQSGYLGKQKPDVHSQSGF